MIYVFKIKHLVLVLTITLISSFSIKAQSDALYSQYMFNQFTINPAYAGSRDALSAVLLYRTQWVGLEGAPNTVNLSAHSPFHAKNMALGVNVVLDEIGPTKSSAFQGTYAYHVKTKHGDLSFGLRGGFLSTTLQKGLLNFVESNDQHDDKITLQAIQPNFDFGTYFYNDYFYAGFSFSHIQGNSLVIQESSVTSLELNRYFNFASGGAIELNNNLVYKPSIMLKYLPGMPLNYDINSSILLNKVLWVGGSYRSTKNIVLLLEYNVNDHVRMGYSYDFDLSPLRNTNSGSHEIFLGTDLNLRKKSPSISPRYL